MFQVNPHRLPMILRQQIQILAEVFAYFTKPLGIQSLPPYFDIHFDQAAAIFNKYPSFVNCVNLSNQPLYRSDESVVIRPKNGFAALWRVSNQIALATYMPLPTCLNSNPNHRNRYVLTGRDAFEHILCGASMA